MAHSLRISTPWLLAAGLVGLLFALNYGTFAQSMPPATGSLTEAATVFLLVLVSNMLIRQVLLLLLLGNGHDGIVEDSLIRLVLLFFPSTKPAGQAAQSVSTALFAAKVDSGQSLGMPPAIHRTYTLGGGALDESVTTEELPSVSVEAEFDSAKDFTSVLFIDAQHAARVALPPVAASLLIASNVWLAAATSNLWLGDRLGVKDALPIAAAPWPLLQVGLIFRLLVPIDVALIAIISDLVVAKNVSAGVRPGFFYLGVSLRCILWAIALTRSATHLGLASGSGSHVRPQ